MNRSIDPAKLPIIEFSKKGILIVEARPGAGKTYCILHRAQYLIEQMEIPPSKILILSFSRAAVKVIKDRIDLIDTNSQITISTFDSYAGRMLYEQTQQLGGSYDQTIEKVTELIKSGGLRNIVQSSIEYLIVDEAQDLTGLRLDLVRALIDSVPGSTLFYDPFQFIYGFTLRGEDPLEYTGQNFNHWIDEDLAEGDYTLINLENETISNYRFNNYIGNLEDIIRGMLVNRQTNDYKSIMELIKKDQRGLSKSKTMKYLQENVETGTYPVIITRDNFQLWSLANDLSENNIPCYIVPKSHERFMPNWIGTIFGLYDPSKISFDQFEEIYRNSEFSEIKLNSRWASLVRIARMVRPNHDYSKNVQIKDIFDGLHQNKALEIVFEEYPQNKVKLASIHRVKGREFEDVILYPYGSMNKSLDREEQDEETRILYVGVTRSKKTLKVFSGSPGWRYKSIPRTSKFRVSMFHKDLPQFVTIGDYDDLDHSWFVKKLSPKLFQLNQQTLKSLQARDELHVYYNPNYKRYLLCKEDKEPRSVLDRHVISVFSEKFNSDMFYLQQTLKKTYRWMSAFRKMITYIGGVKFIELYTGYLPYKEITQANLSGIYLAPRIGNALCILWFNGGIRK